MTPAARISAAIEILDNWLAGSALEQAFLKWSRNSRFAGSKDRAAIRDHIFTAARRKLSDAALGGARSEDEITGRRLMIGQLRRLGHDLDGLFFDHPYAPNPLSAHEREMLNQPVNWPAPHWKLDIPEAFYACWIAEMGEAGEEAARLNQERAPMTLRVNTALSSREQVITSLIGEGREVTPHETVKTALLMTHGNPTTTQAYLKGLVEIQDAHSQELINRLPALSRDGAILDYCAGGGGKALAAYAKWRREVVCYDINPHRMRDIADRAERGHAKLSPLSHAPDAPEYACVLVDAPCSGTGSWRRAPDGKWSMTPQRLDDLVTLQREILTDASRCVAPGGMLYYMTCSLLPSENQHQAEWFDGHFSEFSFVDQYPLDLNSTSDGLYGALFYRQA